MNWKQAGEAFANFLVGKGHKRLAEAKERYDRAMSKPISVEELYEAPSTCPHCGARKEKVMEKEKIQQKADDPLICACLTCQMARIRKIENDQKKTNQESK